MAELFPLHFIAAAKNYSGQKGPNTVKLPNAPELAKTAAGMDAMQITQSLSKAYKEDCGSK